MRRLITTTFVTLDGVMQAPGGPEEDTSNGFNKGGWTVPFFNEEVGEFMDDTMGKPFDLVLGRKTYDIFAGFWPHQDDELAKQLNSAHKYVASRSNLNLAWENSHQIEGNVVDGIRRIKDTDGPELQIHGSGDLIQSLLGTDVIDEMRILTFPVTVGNGKRLFGGGTAPATLEVTKSVSSKTGVQMAVLQPRGDLQTGSFSPED